MASRTPTFKEFWAAYPVHKRRIDAERAWKRMTVKDKLAAMDGIAAYRDDITKTVNIEGIFREIGDDGELVEAEPSADGGDGGEARGSRSSNPVSDVYPASSP